MGAIIYDHATNHMSLHTNSGAEQMRIDEPEIWAWAPRRLTLICTLRVVILPFILNEIVP